MQIIKPNTNIDFVGKNKLFLSISILLIIGTIVLFISKGGLNYGIDFTGGLMIHIKATSPVTAGEVRSILQQTSLKEPVVQDFGDRSSNEFLIRTTAEGIDVTKARQEIIDAFKTIKGEEIEIRRIEMVGPKIGEKLAKEALLAVFFSILFMSIYICGRFEHRWVASAVMAGALSGAVYVAYSLGVGIKIMIVIAASLSIVLSYVLRFNYSLGAMIALIHDVTITLGAIILTNREISISVVAAFLTIVGYSLNDTIIVYDRIRENLRSLPKSDMKKVINVSVNQTLSRTILTAGTTLLALIFLYVMGGGIINDFCFALIVGIVVGTYSSIYIASPVLLFFRGPKVSKM